MHNMNLAFMAKLGWRLLSYLKENKLWAQIIAGRYIRGEANLSKLAKKQGSSNSCRGMSSATSILSRGAKVSLYSGHDTLFWRDVWCGNEPLLNLALHEVPTIAFFRKVCEYWNPTRGWKWDELGGLLPPNMVNILSTIFLRLDMEG